MQIRPGRTSDLPDLLKLESEIFEVVRRDSESSIRNSLKSPHQETWVAEEENQLAGSMTLRFYPRTCRVYSIAVAPVYRGIGIGRQLLELAGERAGLRGCTRIHLEADSKDLILRSWYTSMGYREVGRIADYYDLGWDAIRYRLTI